MGNLEDKYTKEQLFKALNYACQLLEILNGCLASKIGGEKYTREEWFDYVCCMFSDEGGEK